MALGIVQVQHDGTTGVVTLQSDNKNGSLAIQELQGGAAKNLAIETAAKEGLPDPRVSMGASMAPYAVDEKGETVSNPVEQKVAAYRIDISLTRKLV